MLTLTNFIAGEPCPPAAGSYLDDIEPATGAVCAQVPDSSAEDLERAVGSAKEAFERWSRVSAGERAAILLKIAGGIERRLDELARTETIDNGKPLSVSSSVDIPRASANFRFFAHAITQFSSEAHSMGEAALNYTLRDPLGVVGCISPWNLPLYLLTWKVAPGIAAGNCVIAKPSELTPMTACLLGEIANEAGLPPGVLNILHGRGSGIGAALCTHPAIKAISFTGGTKTGAEIARTAAPLFKKLSLELGGKNPTLVFADAEWRESLPEIIRSAFANQGQICLCGSRLLVERSIYEEFRDRFVEGVRSLRVGDPLEPDTDQGALISSQHTDKVLSYVELARQEGGTILTGGNRATVKGRCAGGFFVEPTVVEGCPPRCRTNVEEVFGPFVTLIPFDSEEEAVDIANATEYGLAASVWTSNLQRAHRVARHLECGIVWVNTWMLRDLRTPFGGVKQSGVGREGGLEALRFFTEAKNVCVKL
ncbi:MAG TPA: aldehyde dehydrogenase [Thermoanaerobaculia bacterium]|nr:aldehyde dehydrogenase [Thermoanaerobaculia bacterium]